jgi:hypothetical protein
VPLEWLKAHEQILTDNFDQLLDHVRSCSSYRKPVVVDVNTGAILDGHHRHAIAKKLGLLRIPVILIDYLADTSVTVEVWPECGRQEITKNDVITMSLSDEVFPPKTSRHRIADVLPNIDVPLDVLSRAETADVVVPPTVVHLCA